MSSCGRKSKIILATKYDKCKSSYYINSITNVYLMWNIGGYVEHNSSSQESSCITHILSDI